MRRIRPEHECNDTSSMEQPFYVDRKAPSGTIGYDADLIDESRIWSSQQASNVYGQLEGYQRNKAGILLYE